MTPLGTWKITTYYTPEHGQTKYFNKPYTYEADFRINCSGDCLVTASGRRLEDDDVGLVVACPPPYKLKTKFYIKDVGEVTCEDRGGAIKGKKMDLWVGIGEKGFNNIGQGSGQHEVFLIN